MYHSKKIQISHQSPDNGAGGLANQTALHNSKECLPAPGFAFPAKSWSLSSEARTRCSPAQAFAPGSGAPRLHDVFQRSARSCGLQRVCTHCGCRSFPICSNHKKDGTLILWVPWHFHLGVHPVKGEVRLGEFREMFEAIIHKGIEVIPSQVISLLYAIHLSKIVIRVTSEVI